MRRTYLIALMAALPALSACNPFSPNALMPGPLFSRDFPPAGPPNYQQGMVDGCKTALGAVGSGPYGTFTYAGFHQDVDKALNDPVYYKAWKDAYFYCKYEHDKLPE